MYQQSVINEKYLENGRIILKCASTLAHNAVIVSNVLARYLAMPIAEGLRIPLVMVLATPTIIPNPHLPPFMVHHQSLGLGMLNRIVGEINFLLMASTVSNIDDIHRIQLEAGSTPCASIDLLRRNLRTPLLLGYSPVLGSCPPLPGHRCIPCGNLNDAPAGATGEAFDPSGDPETAALAAFLTAGEAPVYIGWGSMTGFRGGLTRLAMRAVRLSGQRGVIQACWARLSAADLDGEDGEDAELLAWAESGGLHFLGRSVPHTWLFPQCAAVVHHGGCGTTHTALLAGVPQARVGE